MRGGSRSDQPDSRMLTDMVENTRLEIEVHGGRRIIRYVLIYCRSVTYKGVGHRT